jgi:predicted ATPase
VPLHIDGEVVYRIETLDLPGASVGAQTAIRHAAVACFVEQVRALDRHFVFDDRVAGPVVRICRRLDGLPLALKLAAARVPLLGLQEVEQRLDQRLRLLGGGPRQPAERHASLQAALDWSWALLSPSEQAMLGRLSVLQGSFSLELAAALGSDEQRDAWWAIEDLASLVDRSLVEFTDAPLPRYRLLDSVREHARDQLLRAGLLAATSRKAADLLQSLPAAPQPPDPVQLARLNGEADCPDLALQHWLLAADGSTASARLVEVEHHLNQALVLLRMQGVDADAQRVQVLVRLGAITGLTQGLGTPACEAVYREALPLAERLGLTEARFIALFNLQFTHAMRLQLPQVAELGQQVQALAEQSGDERLLLQADHAVYSGSFFYGDLPRTIASAEAGYRRYRPADTAYHCRHFAGHDPGICSAGHAAMALWLAGRLDEADAYLLRLQALQREVAHPPSHIIGNSMAMSVLAWQGDLEAALAEGQAMLDLCRRLEVPVWANYYTVLIGWVQAQQPGAPDATAPGRMAEAIERVLAIGTRFRMPTYRVLLVETLLRHGQLVEGLQQAERCRQEIEAQGEYLAHPFLLVARAGLHQAAGDDARALADWQRALEVSRQLGAGSVALRAATGLGTMLARQDRPDQALACVDEALQPFRRDWQNPDLARARALRDRLQGAGRTHLRAV